MPSRPSLARFGIVLRPAGFGVVVLPAALGCAVSEWQPPPPAGVTYRYDYQGYTERSTTVVAAGLAGPGGGAAFGGAFDFRRARDLTGDAPADPFAESAPIDGIRFNDHLGPRGIRLSPSAPAPAPTLPPAPAPAPGTRP